MFKTRCATCKTEETAPGARFPAAGLVTSDRALTDFAGSFGTGIGAVHAVWMVC
jgi:hypothetical protein